MPLEPADERFQGHRLGLKVHSILWNEWDPIGVNGIFSRLVELDPETHEVVGPAPPDIAERGWPDDEYDTYVWAILRMLSDGCDVHQIATYLDESTLHSMGLTPPDPTAMQSKHRALAEKIVSLRNL
ncbi:MAG: hypothetical protein NW203_15535 [Hyphomonadaceae bacterium]|nr:hypothetical protein [Hyphomonadaceae bacterium]